MQIDVKRISYFGQKDNLGFLDCMESVFGKYNLYRASEEKELWRVLKYGTDRGGFPPKMWENSQIPFEAVIYATTAEDIRLAEKEPDRSSSFKKFAIIEDPVLLIYDINQFVKIADRQWAFTDMNNKLDALKHIVFLNHP